MQTSVYDKFGRLLKMTDAEGQSAYYAYDNVRRMIKSKDRNGQIASFHYDTMGRMTSQNKGETAVSYTYDDLGNMTAMTDGTGTTAYSYTDNNLLKSVTMPEGTSVYTYGQGSRLKNLVNSAQGAGVINSYSYEYDVAGNQTKKTDNGEITQYTYDKLNRLGQVQEPDGTSTAYTFDKNNNIMTKSVTHPAEYAYGFKQNGTDYALTNVSVDNITYAYDANNRLLEETRYIGGDSKTYSGLIEVTSQNSYDPNGNLLKTEKGGQVDNEVVEYQYDELNRLTRFVNAAGRGTNYKYNGQNQRVWKWNDYDTTHYYWDRGYISNERGSGWISANYVGAGGIFARETKKNAEEVTYLLKDGHGNVTSLVKGGVVTKSYDYDAYGVEKNPDPNDTNPFRYCTEYFDEETEYYYLRNRYYNPSNGRFLTEDPAQDGLNWYVYCGNNPVMRVDPTGLKDIEQIIYEENSKYEIWGFVYGQGNWPTKKMQYGTHYVDYNGCELIAVYNALFQLGDRHALASIIYDARNTWGVSWGPGAVLGSHPDQLGSLLTQYGHNYTSTEDRSEFNGMLSVGGTYIVSFWNDGFANGIHTVMFTMVADDKIEVYNYHNGSTEAVPFYADGYQSALDVYLNENGDTIILYKVE